MRQYTILILGSHEGGHAPHAATREALRHAADTLELTINTRWLSEDDLVLYPGLVSEADAVVLAPPGSQAHRVLPDSLLDALKLVREQEVPFLAAGDAHGLVFIELARNLLGMEEANCTWYDAYARDPVVTALDREDAESDAVNHVREVHLAPCEGADVSGWYGDATEIVERADATFALNPDYAAPIEEAGATALLTDAASNRPFLFSLQGVPFHVTAGFLPQLGSTADRPHPLFLALLGRAAAADESSSSN